MYTLYHFPLCPFSRLARLILTEKKLPFQLLEERPWERREELMQLNPALEVPILVVQNHPISSIYAICEYLESTKADVNFLSSDSLIDAEIRRLMNWFCAKLYNEVTKYFLDEKLILHYMGQHSPRINYIKAARTNLKYHLDYIEFLLRRRQWLADDCLSLADLSAAAQISVIDYLNEIDWDQHAYAKEWYAIIKSRPSFRRLLIDRVKGFTPPAHYQNLDF